MKCQKLLGEQLPGLRSAAAADHINAHFTPPRELDKNQQNGHNSGQDEEENTRERYLSLVGLKAVFSGTRNNRNFRLSPETIRRHRSNPWQGM